MQLQEKRQMPAEDNCLTQSVNYKASVKTEGIPDEKIYIGLTKRIWELKDKKKNFNTGWSIITTAAPYNDSSKKCNLCLTEKLCILKADKATLLNKRSELISKCRHENKYYIMNYKNEIT